MKIGVTGARGFIGSWLTGELKSRGHTVSESPVAVWGDTDTIIHLAAIVGRMAGEIDPKKTAEVNAGMTADLAKTCKHNKVRLVYISSSEVFAPKNLYGLSKAWGEQACWLYDPPGLTILRLSMPYGPGYPPGKGRAAITNFLWHAMRGEEFDVHENSTRSYCWIADTVRGIADLVEQKSSGIFNVGRDDDHRSMFQIARLACDTVSASPQLMRLVPTPGGFTPSKPQRMDAPTGELVPLEKGMIQTAAWLQNLLESA